MVLLPIFDRTVAIAMCHRYIKRPAHTSRKCLLRLCKCSKLGAAAAFSRNRREYSGIKIFVEGVAEESREMAAASLFYYCSRSFPRAITPDVISRDIDMSILIALNVRLSCTAFRELKCWSSNLDEIFERCFHTGSNLFVSFEYKDAFRSRRHI